MLAVAYKFWPASRNLHKLAQVSIFKRLESRIAIWINIYNILLVHAVHKSSLSVFLLI